MPCMKITRGGGVAEPVARARRVARSKQDGATSGKRAAKDRGCFGLSLKRGKKRAGESDDVQDAENPEEIEDAIPAPPVPPSPLESAATHQDRELEALAESIKRMYAGYVNEFVKEGTKHGHGVTRRTSKTLHAPPWVWDVTRERTHAFLSLCASAGASPANVSRRVLFGYHGTSAANAAKIMREGFKEQCRRSHGEGAYFSGVMEYSAKYARDHHGLPSRNSAREVPRAPEGPGDILLVALLLDGHKTAWELNRKAPDVPVISATWSVFDEAYTMPLARLRGF